jgi:hypothetical protein
MSAPKKTIQMLMLQVIGLPRLDRSVPQEGIINQFGVRVQYIIL